MRTTEPLRDSSPASESTDTSVGASARSGWRLDGFHLLLGAALLVLVLTNLPGIAQQGGSNGNGTGNGNGNGNTGGGTLPPPIPQVVPGMGAIANSDSNGSMIAVTGTDITGSCVLYLIDTESKQLAVYQASGGTKSLRGVELVGARRIDLDLQLEGYNDKSEYSYAELDKQFQKSGVR
jgi:hypothetical protein